LIRNRKPILAGIAIYQLLGSALQFYLLYQFVGPGMHLGNYVALLPMLCISFISLLAGACYFIYGERYRFYLLSTINFCLQIVQLSVPGFKFAFYCLLYLGVAIDHNYSLQVDFDFFSAFMSFSLNNPEFQFFKLNLVPLVPLLLLRWLEKNPAGREAENAFLKEEEPVT